MLEYNKGPAASEEESGICDNQFECKVAAAAEAQYIIPAGRAIMLADAGW